MARTKTKEPRTALEAVEGIDLSGKVFVVTGAYSGLGAATTRALLQAGATVVAAGRNMESQREFSNELKGSGDFEDSQLDASQTVDLASLGSAADFAKYVRAKYTTVHALINNAGVMNTPAGVTADGFEIQMGTNVIGHFLVAKLLADVTKRQIWLSSKGHAILGTPPFGHDLVRAPRIDLDAITQMDERSYQGWQRYQQSKLGAILLAKQFPLEHPGLTACSVHPGIVQTNLSRHTSIWSLLKFVVAMPLGGERSVSAEVGARTQTMCAVTPELQEGAYYVGCKPSETAECAQNMDDAKRLYDYCDKATRSFQG